jgi:hypothetical protein
LFLRLWFFSLPLVVAVKAPVTFGGFESREQNLVIVKTARITTQTGSLIAPMRAVQDIESASSMALAAMVGPEAQVVGATPCFALALTATTRTSARRTPAIR